MLTVLFEENIVGRLCLKLSINENNKLEEYDLNWQKKNRPIL